MYRGPNGPPDNSAHLRVDPEDAVRRRIDLPGFDTRLQPRERRGLEVSHAARQGRSKKRFSKQQAVWITQQRQRNADDFRRNFEEKWSRWNAQYRQVQLRRREGANRPSPEPFIVVETLMPRIIRALFSLDPAFSAVPRGPGDEELVEISAKLLDTQWKGEMRMDEVLIDFVKYVVKYGTGIAKLIWTDDYSESTQMVQELDELGRPTGQIIGEIDSEQVASFPELLPVPLYDFWIEPTARSIDEADFVVHQTWMPEPVLRQLEEEGIFEGIEELQYDRDDGQLAGQEHYRMGSAFGEYGRDYKLKRAGQPSPYDYDDTVAPLVKIWEYWGSYYDEDGTRYPNMVWTIANERVCIRRPRPNPYDHGQKPFLSCVAHRDEDEFYGIGFLEAIEPTQLAGAALENMMADNLAMSIQQMFLMGAGNNLPVNSIKFRPFGVIPVTNVDQFKKLESQDVVPSAINTRVHLEQKSKMLSGTTDFIRAESSEFGGDTATEVVQSINQSNIRFGLLLVQFKSFLKRVLNQQHELNKQFLETPQAVRLTGREGHRWHMVSGQDIGGSMDFQMLGDEDHSNSQAAQQRFMLLFEKFLGDPVIRQTIDLHEWVSMAMEIFKVPGKGKILIDPQEFKDLAFVSVSPQEELFHMLNGQPHVTRPTDDHDYHDQVHVEQWYEFPHLRPQIEQAIMEHRQAKTQAQMGSNQRMQMGAMGLLNVPPGMGMPPGGGGPQGMPGGAAPPQAQTPRGLGPMGAGAPWMNAL